MSKKMYVVKRDGTEEAVDFNKITKRINYFCKDLKRVDAAMVAMEVIQGMYSGITTQQLDVSASDIASSYGDEHPEYSLLAGRIAVSNLHRRNINKSFSATIDNLYNAVDSKTNKKIPIISDECHTFIMKHAREIDTMINLEKDLNMDILGYKTLEKSYLLKINGKIVESPQYMFMRTAVEIHMGDLPKIKETYKMMSRGHFTHASPTLFNACTRHSQMSSCFLLDMKEDSIDGIYDTLKRCALISKWAGGIGLTMSKVRAQGSYIIGTNGTSNGIIPMLRVFNNTARYCDQCVRPEEYIYTSEGPKQIQFLDAGVTQIVNSAGEVEVVKDVLEHSYDGEVYLINTACSIEPLLITPRHPILTIKVKKNTNYSVIMNRLEKGYVGEEWVEAKDITEDHLVTYTIPTYENDIKSYTEEDCYMYGVLLGDGSMTNDSVTTRIYIDPISKKNVLEFVKKYLAERCVQWKIDETRSKAIVIRWGKTKVLPFRYSDLYDESKQKRMKFKWTNLPIEKAKYIVKGLIDTDGCKGKELVFDTTSRQLIESMRYLLLRMGVPTSGYVRDRVGESHVSKYGSLIINKKKSFCLRIPRTKEIAELIGVEEGKFFKFIKHKNKIYSRISGIKKDVHKGRLYDLQMGKVHDYTTHHGIIHNGGNKRKGSFAMYLEPWHSDVFQWIDLKKPHGEEEGRARDLFYALWTPDIFMERVKANGTWSLFCPNEVKKYFEDSQLAKSLGISGAFDECYGENFEKLYVAAEKVKGLARKTIKARDLWKHIIKSQVETGGPFICYKDAANRKSNQKNVGMIKSSNLCTEIFQHSSDEETAVCNLASIALPILATKNSEDEWQFNFDKLGEIARILTTNLNNVIDRSFYPIESARKANQSHRPIGIGIQGLSDLLQKMGLEYDSDEARTLFENIMETINYNALFQSKELAKEFGPYTSFEGSPSSKGILQQDMCDEKWKERETFIGSQKWNELRADIVEYGLRNNAVVALMPTASSSNILGNSECFEVRSSNLFIRKLLSGEYVCLNKYLVDALEKKGLWTEKIRKKIVARGGSIQTINEIPLKIKKIFKTVWEISGRAQIDMIATSAKHIDHSASMSLYYNKPTYKKLSAAHFYGWGKGLKTGMYYLRTQPAALAIKFALEDEYVEEAKVSEQNVEEEIKVKEPIIKNIKIEPVVKEIELQTFSKEESKGNDIKVSLDADSDDDTVDPNYGCPMKMNPLKKKKKSLLFVDEVDDCQVCSA